MTAGCSGLIATKGMAAKIDANAVTGAKQLASATTQPYSVEEATGLIAGNTAIFTEYRKAATMNLFAFLFDKNKPILCNTVYYTMLVETSAKSDDAPRWLPVMTQAEVGGVLAWQDEVLIRVKRAKDGVK